MADSKQIIKTVLDCVEKVSSFASSINPLFGIVTPLVGVARKVLVGKEAHPLEQDFKQVHEKLESISEKNLQCLREIRIGEVNQTFGKYEQYIKHQYTAFNTMVAQLTKDPEGAQSHMDNYQKVYQRDKSDLSLDVYYRGVMGTALVFGRSLLKVYLDHCERDRAVMEHRCSHLWYLFQIGLIALMAYTAVIKDDEDEVNEKWVKRMEDIQAKMQEALSQCE